MRKGILLISVGLIMIVFDLAYRPVFSLPLGGGFQFPVGALAILVGVLWFMSAKLALDVAVLTQTEVATWGDRLEKATPRIIALSKQHFSSGHIAETIEKEMKIPDEIVLKYLHALRGYVKGSAEQAKADAHKGD